MEALKQVVDALDIETFFLCSNENEGRSLGSRLMEQLGFQDYDIVYIHQEGPGARIRLRAYVHRPGNEYSWLEGGEENG